MSYARWATNDEVVKKLEGVNLETGVKKSGIPLAYDDKYLYINNHEAHSLIIGSTGSGKTQSTILPMLKLAMMANESIVLTDPKGELYDKCAGALKEKGYEVLALNFGDAKYGNGWNPLKLPYELYNNDEKDKAVEMIEDLAYYLFFDGANTNTDPFWFNSTVDYFTGLVLYLFENANIDEIHLQSICELSNKLNDKNNSILFINKLDKKSKTYINLAGTLNAPSDTKGSIIAVFNQKMKKYISRENLSNMLSYTDFDITEISNKPTALFIISGISNYCNNLIPLLVDQIIKGVDYFGKQTSYTNILLDEFDAMVPIRNFSSLITYCRSIKIKLAVTIRSYIHLSNMYSKEEAEILKMCFGNLVYLLSDDIYTLEEISKYCGNTLVDNKLERLVTVEDLKTIKTFEAIVIIPRMMPFKTKLLPDYQIDWGINFPKIDIPKRTQKEIKYYEEKM